MTMNPASRYGPVAEGEYDRAADAHKPGLTSWLNRLHTLDDDEFRAEAASAILWEHEHCKATAAYAEAVARHRAAGHTDDCTGDTLYSVAFAEAWCSQGHSRDAYPPKPCTCGAVTAARTTR